MMHCYSSCLPSTAPFPAAAAASGCRLIPPLAASKPNPKVQQLLTGIVATTFNASTKCSTSCRCCVSSTSSTNLWSSSSSSRREAAVSLGASLLAIVLASPEAAMADEEDQEYVKETNDVIKKVRSTVGMEKTDPGIAEAVAELREASNAWVAKYRREKALLGRASFRDMYSALNAVSGHYISFGPTAPIPAKRKARILEEVDTAEKALLRGR